MEHGIVSHPTNHFLSGAIDLIAGSLGGCANVLVGQPLDTVKVKLQTYPSLYPSAYRCFVQTLQSDGIRHGLYAGTVPALAANIAENSILFCAYGFCQKYVTNLTGSQSATPSEKAFAGSFAAFFASFTLCPTELIKCKLQALRETGNADSHIGPFKMTKNILKTEGIRGLYYGLSPTLAREMPGYFCFFGGYEASKRLLSPNTVDSNDIGLGTTVLAGGIGGVCFWTAVFPFDVIKSRMQVSGSSASLLSVLTSIAQQEGISGLYKGLLPTVLRTFPATGALFVAYEYSKSFMTDLFS